jgi:hypothetical protein
MSMNAGGRAAFGKKKLRVSLMLPRELKDQMDAYIEDECRRRPGYGLEDFMADAISWYMEVVTPPPPPPEHCSASRSVQVGQTPNIPAIMNTYDPDLGKQATRPWLPELRRLEQMDPTAAHLELRALCGGKIPKEFGVWWMIEKKAEWLDKNLPLPAEKENW